MVQPSSLPSAGPSREEVAHRELGHTEISAPVARALVGFFLVAIAAVPLYEILGSPVSAGSRAAWTRVFSLPSVAAVAGEVRTDSGLWRRTVGINRAVLAELSAFEDALEDGSRLGRTLRPPAQQLLSGWLGAGNERVYVGRSGWLFFTPDVEYLSGPPFLDETSVRARIESATEWERLPQPDPRPAILQFHRQLQERGIALIVMPTPVKPAIHPERLSVGAASAPVQNPSFERFMEDLERAGVAVFDPAPALAAARQSGPQYLATDTHWRPEAMELAAAELAGVIRRSLDNPASAGKRYRAEEREIVNGGDTAAMLDLPEGQQLYPPERVWVRRVTAADGTAWQPARDAAILLLGDSFTNIYSLPSMGWGDSAGFAEQVSFALNQPLDRLVQNDAGAYATREQLVRAGPERLSGKRLIVWQFAVRELAFGDWRTIDLPR